MMKVSEIKTDEDLARFAGAVKFAIDAANNVQRPARGNGCGRAYVDLGKFRGNSKAAIILARHGLKLMSRPYQKHKSIYIGYDNSTGAQLAQAAAFATAMRSCGFDAFDDADED